MNCNELKEVMRGCLDQELDSRTLREVGVHLAGCPQCEKQINGKEFWDQAVLVLLDHEAPAGLRHEILGDLENNPGLSSLDWKKKLKLMIWGVGRKKTEFRDWVELAVIVAGAVWLLPLLLDWLSSLR